MAVGYATIHFLLYITMKLKPDSKSPNDAPSPPRRPHFDPTSKRTDVQASMLLAMATNGLRLPLRLAILLVAAISVNMACALVPANARFRYVNEGELQGILTEYGATYRPPGLSAQPFDLVWYNSTPGQYYLGLRLGILEESGYRFLWDANRGRPVGEGATLSLGKDGDLVLAEASGKVVWSTGTANKGVVGIKLLPTGNLVLYDKQGKFLWQSFSYPTDTLLFGQSLSLTGTSKLVSRKSVTDNSEGIYSFVLEPTGPRLYVAASPKPLLYSNDWFSISGGLTSVTLRAGLTFRFGRTAHELYLEGPGGGVQITLAQIKYNSTFSFLRIAPDGNLEAYTYNDVDGYWDRIFLFFSSVIKGVLQDCELPSKCGALGMCTKDMCVACPKANGLYGWSETCAPPALRASCGSKKSGTAAASGYYKVVGVESFIPRYNKGLGKVNVDDCKKKCSADCSCLGIFYWEEESTCWLAPILGSLSSVSNTSHVAYIKRT